MKDYTKNTIERTVISKARRYVDNPNDAPEGVEVQEGPQGGYYYETESEIDVGGPHPDAEMDETIEHIYDTFSPKNWITVNTKRQGPIRGTIDGVDTSSLQLTDTDGNQLGIPAEEITDVRVTEEDEMRNTIQTLDEGEPVTVETENMGPLSGTVERVPEYGLSLRIRDEGGTQRGIPVQDIHGIEREVPPAA